MRLLNQLKIIGESLNISNGGIIAKDSHLAIRMKKMNIDIGDSLFVDTSGSLTDQNVIGSIFVGCITNIDIDTDGSLAIGYRIL